MPSGCSCRVRASHVVPLRASRGTYPSADRRTVADLHAFRVGTALPCKRCAYDLRGLHADGRCPECGTDVLETVALRVDPELALLPPLRHPRRAGTSLFVLAAALSAATVGTSASAAALLLSRLPNDGWRGWLASVFPPSVPARLFLVPPVALVIATASAALLIATCGLVGARRFLLLFALGAWLAASWFVPEPLHLALTGVIAMLALAGLGRIVSHLGQRSRTYRRAAHAQQAIGPLTTAIAIGVLGVLIADLSTPLIGGESATMLRLISAVCLAMTNVGFLYLLANAYWIWRSLWAWQPLLERVLDRPAPTREPVPPTTS